MMHTGSLRSAGVHPDCPEVRRPVSLSHIDVFSLGSNFPSMTSAAPAPAPPTPSLSVCVDRWSPVWRHTAAITGSVAFTHEAA